MTVVATVLVSVQVCLGILHLYWGFGGRWPGHDEQSLVERIVGTTRQMKAPSLAAAAGVAGGLFAAAGLVWLYTSAMPSGDLASLVRLGYWGAASVFLVRGVAGYVPFVFRYAEGTPFHELNRSIYSPICLAIFLGFAVNALR